MRRDNTKATYSGLFVGVTGLFVASLIAANIISVKLIAIGDWFVPAGVVIFPLSYILGDVLTEVYGFRSARRVIWLGFLCNLVVVIAISVAWSVARRALLGRSGSLGPDPRLRAAPPCGLFRGLSHRRVRQLDGAGPHEGSDGGQVALVAHHRLHYHRARAWTRWSSSL
jgi:hypothetical protein